MEAGAPRLPPELLEQIVMELALPCTYGDPTAARTLAACSLVCRAMRHWALQARFDVVVSPRHVRDFRRWYARSQRDMAGYARALFVALDDVSKLTSNSAGWDTELLKLLQQQGPHLIQLSLWTSETRAVLRDPAQIRGPRVRRTASSAAPSLIVGDVMRSNAKRRRNVTRMMRHLRQGRFVRGDALSTVPLKTDFTQRNEAQTRAELAAAKERARQTLPNWLKHELASTVSADRTKAAQEVKRRYKAHIVADAREYQHEREAGQEARKELKEAERAALDALQQQDATRLGRTEEADLSDEEDGDVEVDWSCMPKRLSICPSLPLHEHEEMLNFCRMTIWTRVEELDVYVAVPAEVPRCLELLSFLVASPLRKFRFSSLYASLLISLTPEGEAAGVCSVASLHQPDINIAGGLAAVLRSEVFRSILLDEFHNHRCQHVDMLESAIASCVAATRSCDIVKDDPSQSNGSDDADAKQMQSLKHGRKRNGDGLFASLPSFGPDANHSAADARTLVSVRILNGAQAQFAKLKDRRQDFLSRALDAGPDCWLSSR